MLMKMMKKETYGVPLAEIIEGAPEGILCNSALEGGNTEDLTFDDWDFLLVGGGGIL